MGPNLDNQVLELSNHLLYIIAFCMEIMVWFILKEDHNDSQAQGQEDKPKSISNTLIAIVLMNQTAILCVIIYYIWDNVRILYIFLGDMILLLLVRIAGVYKFYFLYNMFNMLGIFMALNIICLSFRREPIQISAYTYYIRIRRKLPKQFKLDANGKELNTNRISTSETVPLTKSVISKYQNIDNESTTMSESIHSDNVKVCDGEQGRTQTKSHTVKLDLDALMSKTDQIHKLMLQTHCGKTENKWSQQAEQTGKMATVEAKINPMTQPKRYKSKSSINSNSSFRSLE